MQSDLFWNNVDLALDELSIKLGRRLGDAWLSVNCGVTQASISLSRSRGSIPKYNTVEKMAEVLNVPASQLRTGIKGTRVYDLELAEQVAKLPHFADLASYLIKMDASQLLELVHDAKIIYESSTELE